ncbi:MAG: hypothetical protein LBF60_07470 [Treponema sp.]|jgi:hypothetical protein|nr:hypothetical protein [Treponema sp.]
MRESIETRGERSKNGMKWKVVFLFMLFCLKPPDAAHTADIDFAWTLGEFRFAFSNGGGDMGAVNFACTFFSFDIFETYTGLGVKISPFSVEYGSFDTFPFFFLPLELYYNPFVFRLSDWTSFNMGVYVRGGYGFFINPFARLPGDGFYGAAGARISFATLPIGRKPVVDYSSGQKRLYYMNTSLFAEYTSVNTVRIGVSLDNIAIVALFLLGAVL